MWPAKTTCGLRRLPGPAKFTNACQWLCAFVALFDLECLSYSNNHCKSMSFWLHSIFSIVIWVTRDSSTSCVKQLKHFIIHKSKSVLRDFCQLTRFSTAGYRSSWVSDHWFVLYMFLRSKSLHQRHSKQFNLFCRKCIVLGTINGQISLEKRQLMSNLCDYVQVA